MISAPITDIQTIMLVAGKKPNAPQKNVYNYIGNGMGFKAGPFFGYFP